MYSGKRIPFDMLIKYSNDWTRKSLRKANLALKFSSNFENLSPGSTNNDHHPMTLSSRSHHTRTDCIYRVIRVYILDFWYNQ